MNDAERVCDTGIVIATDSKRVLFTIIEEEDHYCITFLKADTGSFIEEEHLESCMLEPDEKGFIYGRMHDGFGIAIYIAESIKVVTSRKLNTWLYIKTNSNLQESFEWTFDAIRVAGPAVNIICPPDRIFFDRKGNRDGEKVIYTDDSFSVPIENACYKELEFGSVINERMSAAEGNYIKNDHSYFEMKLADTACLDGFLKYYEHIQHFLQFLIFRKNISISEIELCKKKGADREITFAKCYIKPQYSASNKNWRQIIAVRELKTECIANLFNLMENVDGKPLQYNVGFIPEDDKKARYITTAMIGSICSSIETELVCAKIEPDDDPHFRELLGQVKEIITEHKKSDNALEEKTYQNIFSNMKHWNEALSDSIYKLYCQNREVVNSGLNGIQESTVKDQISAFVKFRNDITHGRYRVMTEQIADSAYMMMVLVYCCILKRAKVDDKTAKKIMGLGVVS